MKTSMIEFSVENFKMFKDTAKFSMSSRKSDHTFERNGENLLKTTMIYGPNASGKTTLIEAIGNMRGAVLKSANPPESKNDVGSDLPYQPFLLSTETESKPTTFEIVLSVDDSIYRYAFSYRKDHIAHESLSEILSNGSEKKISLSDAAEDHPLQVGSARQGSHPKKLARMRCSFRQQHSGTASSRWTYRQPFEI